MARALYMFPGLALLVGCALPPDNLCPCQGGTSCHIESHRCISLDEKPVVANGSVIYDRDSRLYCGNVPGKLYRAPTMSSEQADTMTTDYSWFLCWEESATPDDDTIWFRTVGDVQEAAGWMPADVLGPPPDFKADPGAYGFRRCPAS